MHFYKSSSDANTVGPAYFENHWPTLSKRSAKNLRYKADSPPRLWWKTGWKAEKRSTEIASQ